MNDVARSEEEQSPPIDELYKRFNAAYKELREAWIKTGGGMDMEISIRDAGAEVAFKRRSAAAQKGVAKRRKHG